MPPPTMPPPNDPHFQQTRSWTFTGPTLPPGLIARDQLIGATGPSTRPRQYDPANVSLRDGYLLLTVPGGQRDAPVISGAAVSTDFLVRYASVRTYAVLCRTPGVVNGMFFYRSDSQEIDIEWVSDARSPANHRHHHSDPHSHSHDSPLAAHGLHYTNQALSGREAHASRAFAAHPPDAFEAVHEYRVDWTPGATRFFLDGALQAEHRANVPEGPGRWNWNNWSNGNPGFAMGPPESEAVFMIREIVMHYDPGEGSGA